MKASVGVSRQSRGDVAFQWLINAIALIIGLITLYPLIYTLSASLSEPLHIMRGDVVLFPVGFTLDSYRRVFASANILNGYKNTLIYAFCGTTINVRNLGLMNTVWAVLLPGAINATNMLIMRNYFIHSIPGELREAASIDGCSPLRTMTSIILPLSKSILIVVTLYYFVGHWNSYFDAMMYLRDSGKYPLQVILRQILLLSQMGDMAEQMGVNDLNTTLIYASLKYAIIVVSAVPLLVIYPMIQRFFEKGIMMGSVKG